MGNYLETLYFRDEYSEDSYPQKLCDYLVKTIIQPKFNNIEDKTLLDIGSGKGNHMVGFGRRGMKVLGLDKRDECINISDELKVYECDIENDSYPIDDNSMDVVFTKSVIEHINNVDNLISEAYRVLKPGGIGIFMTPDWGTQYKTFWDDYTHVSPWTRKSLQNALLMHSFSDVKCTLFRQLPILWKFPFLSILSDITSILPESFKWKDHEETKYRTWVRFSKEKMLLGIGIKGNS